MKRDKFKLILKSSGFEIRANQLNWMLYIPSPRSFWYYSTLSDLLTELLNLKIKEFATRDTHHSLKSLRNAIDLARKEIKEIIDSLTTIKISEPNRSELHESTNNQKND